MEIIIRQLRSCASATTQQQKLSLLKNATTSNLIDESKILSDTEQSVRQIMQLINR